eukprot:scaffold17385_cov75-Cyclotella_meneghiniana.AAC.1
MDIPAVEAPSTSVKPKGNVMVKSKRSPLDTALLHLERFASKLRWSAQHSAYRQFGKIFLQKFANWYHESQSIQQAETQGDYKPQACEVKSTFLLPSERVREGEAYKHLLARAIASCDHMTLERGGYHLEMRKINNDGAREMILELAAFSIWRMANTMLATLKAEAYNAHNLVADVLELDHESILKELCGLEEFIKFYKIKHRRGREVEDPDIMFARRFGTADEPDESATNKDPPPPASPTTNDAIRDIHSVPPTTGGKSAENLPTSNLFNEAPAPAIDASVLEKLNRDWSERCALILAACSDSANMKKLQEHNPQLSDLGKIGQNLINKEGGIASTIAKKMIDPNTKPPAKPSANQTTPTKRKQLASPKIIFDRYSRKYRFTREETLDESIKRMKKVDETLLKHFCKNLCLINSIRDPNFQLPNEPPPKPTAASLQNVAAQAGYAEMPNFDYGENEAPKTPPDEMNKINLDLLGQATGLLRWHCEEIFRVCVRIFKAQCERNHTIDRVNAAEDEAMKAESARATAAVTWNEQNQTQPYKKTMDVIATDAATKATRKESRKQNNKIDSIDQRITAIQAELRKLKKEQKKRKRDSEDTDDSGAKAPGGHNSGAHQTNTQTEDQLTPTPQTQLRMENPYQKKQKKRKDQKSVPVSQEMQLDRENPSGGNDGRVPADTNTLQPHGPKSPERARKGQGGPRNGGGRGESNNKFRQNGPKSGRGRGRDER